MLLEEALNTLKQLKNTKINVSIKVVVANMLNTIKDILNYQNTRNYKLAYNFPRGVNGGIVVGKC